MRGDIRRFPPTVLNAVEPRLQLLLQSYVYRSEVPRCLLAFLSDERFLELRPNLITDLRWRIYYAAADSGLIGEAIRANDIVFWSNNGLWSGRGSEKFSRGDSRTIGEVAAPVLFQGAPTAVFLIDYFEGEILPDRIPLRIRVAKWIAELSEALISLEREDSRLRAEIASITLQCVKETRSVRGYTALKKWDGTISYFMAGQDVDRFKYLNQLEGICGEVFRKGDFQNVGYVWDHPRYIASDDRVSSEAVAPIVISDDVVGVLNVEALGRNHYKQSDEEKIKEYAKQLTQLAVKYRSPAWSDIGIHSRLLSDLIESFSIPNDYLSSVEEYKRIEEWAFDLVRKKVCTLEVVRSADLVEVEGKSELLTSLEEEFTQTAGGIDSYHVHEGDASCEVVFPMLVDGRPKFYLVILCAAKPDREILEIVEQFCRLTVNEIRRRMSELRLLEFEQLMVDIRLLPWGVIMQTAPDRIMRMLNCDHVTYFEAMTIDNKTVLVPSSSTAVTLEYRTKQTYYTPTVDDGFTGFSGTRREVLLIKNAKDTRELQNIHPNLRWRGKIAEDSHELFRSFFAIPIWSPNKLIGVLRGHRTIKHKNMSFSDQDKKRLELIQFVLEVAWKNEEARQSNEPASGERGAATD
jgi:GAF domain-containing protein